MSASTQCSTTPRLSSVTTFLVGPATMRRMVPGSPRLSTCRSHVVRLEAVASGGLGLSASRRSRGQAHPNAFWAAIAGRRSKRLALTKDGRDLVHGQRLGEVVTLSPVAHELAHP